MLLFLTPGHAQAFGVIGERAVLILTQAESLFARGDAAVCCFCKNRRCLDMVAMAPKGVSVPLKELQCHAEHHGLNLQSDRHNAGSLRCWIRKA